MPCQRPLSPGHRGQAQAAVENLLLSRTCPGYLIRTSCQCEAWRREVHKRGSLLSRWWFCHSALKTLHRWQALAAAARTDKEEWVGVIGRAVGDFSGVLDMPAVVEGSASVRPPSPCNYAI